MSYEVLLCATVETKGCIRLFLRIEQLILILSGRPSQLDGTVVDDPVVIQSDKSTPFDQMNAPERSLSCQSCRDRGIHRQIPKATSVLYPMDSNFNAVGFDVWRLRSSGVGKCY